MKSEKDTNLISEIGLKKLEDELFELKNIKRPEVISRIKAARCFGLIENSEYATAIEDQGFVEGRIAQIEKIMKNAEVINRSNLSMDKISVGHVIKIRELPDGEEECFEIVGSAEADPLEGKLSQNAPLAKQLLGKSVGEKVEVKTLDGIIYMEILTIE